MNEAVNAVLILCVYLIPVGVIAGSKRSAGNEKSGWIISAIFLSWIALVVYYSVVPTPKERKLREIQRRRKHLKPAQSAKAAQTGETQDESTMSKGPDEPESQPDSKEN